MLARAATCVAVAPGQKHVTRAHRNHQLYQSAFMPWICQGLVAPPGEPPPITDAPFKSQTTTCPLVVLYQRMSLLPSPLKSPVSTIVKGLGAEPGAPPPITDAPLSSQITACPVV